MPDSLDPEKGDVIVAIGCDHAGREHKELFLKHLAGMKVKVLDVGVAPDVEKANYPDVAIKVAKLIQDGQARFGVLICGTGVGMAMVANRFMGVRAANCPTELVAVMARGHNDANILTIGQRTIGPSLALAILKTFLTTGFEAGRHQERINLFEDIYGTKRS
ncbi:MAG: ribose 5-phosphate isomerase B [Deltaproteobacteria bacterium]|nr:ribose 5-phosphate isomerase B [Deltaproteobacteria bacterium]